MVNMEIQNVHSFLKPHIFDIGKGVNAIIL